jgi:hypothetical protein
MEPLPEIPAFSAAENFRLNSFCHARNFFSLITQGNAIFVSFPASSRAKIVILVFVLPASIGNAK